MGFFRFAVLTIGFCAVFPANTTYAAERLDFISRENFIATPPQKHIMEHEFSAIAAIDLNEDSVNEYILQKAVQPDAPYQFEIFALSDTNLISLGIISGYKLMLNDNRHHGVQSILSFNNAENDFAYDIFQWSPASSQYVNAKSVHKGDKT